MKKASRKERKERKGYTKCLDCGGSYKIGAPHQMFCEARTCTRCGTTVGYALEEDDGERVCDRCVENADEDES